MSIKKYSKEFKLDAISLVLEQGYGRSEAAELQQRARNLMKEAGV